MVKSQDPRFILRNVDQAEVISNPSCHLPLDNTTSLKRSNDTAEAQNGKPAACALVNEFEPPVEDSTETETQLSDGEVDLGFGTRNPGKILPHVAERHKENILKKAIGDPEQDEELLVINLNYEDVTTMQELENDITDTSEDAPMIPSPSAGKK